MRNGSVTTGPTPGHHVHAEPDGGRGHDDVAEEDGGVDVVAAHRLEGDLRGRGGIVDGVEDAALAAQRPVLGQRAAGLAHEPHGHPGGGQATGGAEEGGVGELGGGGHGLLNLRPTQNGGEVVV